VANDKNMKQNTSAKTKNESGGGMPGDGAGRKEKPGKSGVYPMSGPLPEDADAPLEDMASWGQGERGAAGRKDHGESEVMTMPPDSTSESSEAQQGGR
jgi:hypothetical protein